MFHAHAKHLASVSNILWVLGLCDLAFGNGDFFFGRRDLAFGNINHCFGRRDLDFSRSDDWFDRDDLIFGDNILFSPIGTRRCGDVIHICMRNTKATLRITTNGIAHIGVGGDASDLSL